MNTRRKFLLQGSLATAALAIGNSFDILANTASPLTGFSFNNKKIVLLHTSDANTRHLNHTINQIKAVKKNADNMLLIHAGDAGSLTSTGVKHDVTAQCDNLAPGLNNSYQIIHKGAIKIGVIKTALIEQDIIGSINALSKKLKEEKSCQLVVCLSHAGYKNTDTFDDLTLAEKSTNLDIIISGHPSNFKSMPVIKHNSNNEEVIINSGSNNGFGLGNIEISFDKNDKKYSIDFNNLLKRSSANS
jgi:2',3'-cyclic-nucleotide 2'-phosphodiesterase (5'-nucleotidase family)